MRLRPGMVASTLLTIALSLGIVYLSIQILGRAPFLSSLGVVASIFLILVSTLVLKGKEVAILLLSIFYIALGVLGLLLIPALPSEGMLTFLFSVTVGSYLLRHRGDPFKPEDLSGVEEESLAEEPLEEGGEIEEPENFGDEFPLGGKSVSESIADDPMDM